MENKNSNNRIMTAGFGKRFLAFIIDYGIVAIASLLLWNTVGAGAFLTAIGNGEMVQELYGYADASGLFSITRSEDGTPTAMAIHEYVAGSETSEGESQGGYGYELYLKESYDAYTVFLTGTEYVDQTVVYDGTTYDSKDFYTAYRFGNSLLGLPSTETLASYTAEQIAADEDLIDDENHYFKWALGSDGLPDYSVSPVVTSAAAAIIADTSSSERTSTLTGLRNTFYNATSSSTSGVYVDIVNTVLSQQYYMSRYNQWVFNSWASLAVFYLPLAFIVFFVVPLFFKDGQTLGKKVAGICLLGIDDYAIRWGAHLAHPFAVFIVVSTACIIPFNYMSQYLGLMAFMIICIIDYMFAFMDKSGRNRSLTDRITKTRVIDAKASVWFATPEAQEAYEETEGSFHAESGFFDEPASKEELDRIAYEDSILDLSTLDRHRKEAEAITDFDSFEAGGVAVSEGLMESTQNEADRLAKEKGLDIPPEDEIPAKEASKTKKPSKKKVSSEDK